MMACYLAEVCTCFGEACYYHLQVVYVCIVIEGGGCKLLTSVTNQSTRCQLQKPEMFNTAVRSSYEISAYGVRITYWLTVH